MFFCEQSPCEGLPLSPRSGDACTLALAACWTGISCVLRVAQTSAYAYLLSVSHLEHSSFLLTLHFARIWEWGVAQEACTAVPGLLRQVRSYAWCSHYACRPLALSSAVVSTLLSVRLKVRVDSNARQSLASTSHL